MKKEILVIPNVDKPNYPLTKAHRVQQRIPLPQKKTAHQLRALKVRKVAY